jgi:hypothetical protein
MRALYLSLLLIVSYQMAFSQKNGIGIGVEVNQTRFRQYAPTVNVSFENPHKAGVGVGAYLMFFHRFSNKFILNAKPGLSILNTESDVTSAHTFQYFIMNGELGYFFNKSNRVNLGIEYGYIINFLATFNAHS